MIQLNKFGLILSCILKDMNFLIFRDFSRNFDFMNLFRFILNKKNQILLHADMARSKTASPHGNIGTHHVAHASVWACVSSHVRTCARV